MRSLMSSFIAVGLLLLLSAAAQVPDDPPAPDSLYRAYLNSMDKGERQMRETLAPAQTTRDQKIAEVNAAYRAIADHAKQNFITNRKKCAADTIAAYDAQIKEVTRSGDLDKALAIRSAKDRFVALAGAADIPGDDDGSADPTVPSIDRQGAVTPCWNVGRTGNDSCGNVYGLSVQQRHAHTDLLFRIALTSPNSNSDGDVFLIDPTGKQVKVWSWTPAMRLPVISTDFRDLDKTRLVKVDISKWMTGKGLYQVKFAFRQGESAPLDLGRRDIRPLIDGARKGVC